MYYFYKRHFTGKKLTLKHEYEANVEVRKPIVNENGDPKIDDKGFMITEKVVQKQTVTDHYILKPEHQRQLVKFKSEEAEDAMRKKYKDILWESLEDIDKDIKDRKQKLERRVKENTTAFPEGEDG